MGSKHNDEEAFEALLSLYASYPDSVYVKISALFRLSKLPFPHVDLRPRVLALLRSSTSTHHRLLWGSDFPFILLGGHEQKAFANGFAPDSYSDSASVFDRWNTWPNTGPEEKL